MKKNKKAIVVIVVAILLIILGLSLIFINSNKKEEKKEEKETKEELKKLPLPEVTGGERGQLGIDKNINESNIDEYLNRSDSVYRDMRMLDDPANYENIGGDRFLSGYIKGFEVVPLPYIIPVNGLPDAVGKTYSGRTLFDIDEEGKYIPNYQESMSIIEELFPKDKVIFLMCGGGGYAGMTKAFLVSLGWDETKIYNIGGHWYYDGKNNIKVEKNETGYDFSSVPYHEIKFDELTEIEREVKLPIYIDDKYYNYEVGTIKGFGLEDYDNELRATKGTPRGDELDRELNKSADEAALRLNKMLENRESFILSVFPSETCLGDAGESLTGNMFDIASKTNLYFYNTGLLVYRKTELYKIVKYAPTVIIVYKGKVLAYIDAESDEDLKYSKSVEELEKWLTQYVYLNK